MRRGAGTQAWVKLYSDGSGSNAQILMDGNFATDVATAGGPPWDVACNELYGWTRLVPYGTHTVSVVKNEDAGIVLYVSSIL